LNAGLNNAMGQAAHGSAPDIAGQDIANPFSLVLSASMLLSCVDIRSPSSTMAKRVSHTKMHMALTTNNWRMSSGKSWKPEIQYRLSSRFVRMWSAMEQIPNTMARTTASAQRAPPRLRPRRELPHSQRDCRASLKEFWIALPLRGHAQLPRAVAHLQVHGKHDGLWLEPKASPQLRLLFDAPISICEHLRQPRVPLRLQTETEWAFAPNNNT
jgi:hypothetical protein